ncbi:MAG: DUF91 domain-containing protein [Gemmatimonadetes bacterium]|nr:DUF91 domain-containing protein [Gemmatimonadota bacterium]MXY81330.1 DUF91 domain-containing protein [Gemmatimonadota bacterium]MYB71026.1 DUF91 domain-containing protein [Gemmatimonadota bacterium]
MALFKWNKDNLKDDLLEIKRTEFAQEKDLQRLLRDKPEAIERGLFIVAEEYSNWAESSRRIDLLGLDKEGNIVVVELKRDKGTFMDLQAIRYAALVSTMTFNDLVKAHTAFLSKREQETTEGAESQEEPTEASRKSLLSFLDKESDDEVEIGSTPRIILVAPEFPIELTTAVLWLNDQELDVKCVQTIPYKLGEELLIDISQVIPLKEAADYQVEKSEKEREARGAQKKRTQGELTHKILTREGFIKQGLRPLPKEEGDINPGDPKRRTTFTGNGGKVVWEEDGEKNEIPNRRRKDRDRLLSVLAGSLRLCGDRCHGRRNRSEYERSNRVSRRGTEAGRIPHTSALCEVRLY